jgi:hypothetical protein
MSRPGLLEPSTGPPAISRTRRAGRRTPSATQTDLRSADHVGVLPHTPTATPSELTSQRGHPTARSPKPSPPADRQPTPSTTQTDFRLSA